MDRKWEEIRAFFNIHKVKGAIIGSSELAELGLNIIPLDKMDNSSISVEYAIIHKGEINAQNARQIEHIATILSPCFANSVFVVFSQHKKIFDIKKTSHYISLAKKISFYKMALPLHSRNLTGEEKRKELEQIISELLYLTKPSGEPNISNLWKALNDIDILRLNIKNFGYELGKRLQSQIMKVDTTGEPRKYGLVSKATTQADIESPWFNYWCQEIGLAPICHRKLWEFSFTLQCLFDHSKLEEGIKGLGFGCGQEPLPSYFASKNISVTVTDLHPDEVKGKGWAETNQHTSALHTLHYENLVAKETFESNVDLQYVDMNNIPIELNGYDFCWSICALEHLGSIQKGLNFIESSLKTLKPGGVAIHTTEFNYTSSDKTIDNWPTVLFRRKDFEQLYTKLIKQGHKVESFNYDVGDNPIDRFIDIPPYSSGVGYYSYHNNNAPQLKLSIDGFPCTCFGIVIIKGGG